MMAIATSFCFTACSDDDDEPSYPTPNPVEQSEITFDTDTVKVGVHETSTFNITDGAGDYKVIPEDTAVATAAINGNTVTVKSQKKGITGIVVSDAKGAYKRIMVKSMYFNMKLNKNEVSIGMKLGHNDGNAKVIVLEGNGNYTASCADEEIARVTRITGDSAIEIQGIKTGTTTVTVTDMMGLTQNVKVNVETTTIPYTDDEKQDIMSDNSSRWVWDGRRNQSSSYNYTHKISEDGRTVAYNYYESRWYSMPGAEVWFTGDFTVGKKTNGRIYYKPNWGSGYDYNENVEVEIIKNDGSKAWGIFSVVADNYLHYGYFVIDL